MLPIDDRRSERFNPAIAGRPDLLDGRKSLTVYPGMTGMMENAFINVKGVHHTITAEVELTDDKTNGVIIAQAGYFGGWTLYMKDGKPHHEYNWFALERTNIGGDDCARARQAHDQLRIHPRRRQARHRRQIDPQRRRQEGRRSADPQDPALRVLRRRRRGRGPRLRDERLAGLQAERERLHRQDRQGDRRAEVECRYIAAPRTQLIRVVTIWFARKAPAGQEGYLVQTIPRKDWITILRLFGPLEP